MYPYSLFNSRPKRIFGRVFRILIVLLMICLSFHLGAQANDSVIKAFARNPNLDRPDSIQSLSAYFRETDDLEDWISLHLNVGTKLIYQADDLEKGFESLRTALQLWRKPATAKEWEKLGLLHLNIGYMQHRYNGDFLKAREHYEIARSLYQDTLHHADVYLADYILIPLGNIHARFRDYEKARYFLQQAKNICLQKETWDKAALAINGIGMTYLTQYQYKQSISCFQEGLHLLNLSPDPQVRLMLNLGIAFLNDTQPEKALSWTLEAQQLLEQQPDKFTKAQSLEHWADLHDNLGNIYQDQRQWREAANHFHQFIGLTIEKFGAPGRREVSQAYLELCDLFLASGQPDSSLHYAQLALRNLLPDSLPSGDFANPAASQLFAEHSLYLAFEQKITALRTLSVRRPADTRLLSLCLETCDRLFFTDEILRREYAFDESKLYRQEESRPYFDLAITTAYRLQALTLDPALTERAWQYAEMARERRLIESMHERDQETAAHAPEATKQQLADLQAARTKLQTRIFEKKLRNERVDSLEALLVETGLSRQGILTSVEKPEQARIDGLPHTDLSAVQQLLPPNTALLEYFSGDSAVYVFILTGRALIFRQCPALSNLNLTVGDLRRALTDKNLRDLEDDFPLFSQSSRLLYDALLAPSLAALPSSIQHLMIVPDGLLHEVPFELLGKATESVNFKSFPYLLRRFTVGYASSASLLLKQSEAARQPEAPGLQSFIGFAPQYSDADTLGQLVSRTRAIELREGKYPDLPESRKEVREIAELLQGKAYLGAEASERQFKKHAAQGRILHLAMHTWLENRDPLFSKLFFTQNRQETEEDNDLNAVELYDLHLQARLVVLSACETGLGKIRQGEGVMSLARAFAYAGVPATLMSLWQVEDQATHALMVDFYRQLKTGLSKDQALQGAKLNYLGNCQPERASPYYWGGFVVSGSLNPLFRQ